jgi:hypothetical protein
MVAAAMPWRLLAGGPLPVPVPGVGDDGMTVSAAAQACIVHTMMVDR